MPGSLVEVSLRHRGVVDLPAWWETADRGSILPQLRLALFRLFVLLDGIVPELAVLPSRLLFFGLDGCVKYCPSGLDVDLRSSVFGGMTSVPPSFALAVDLDGAASLSLLLPGVSGEAKGGLSTRRFAGFSDGLSAPLSTRVQFLYCSCD